MQIDRSKIQMEWWKHNGARKKVFIKLRDIGNSKEDSLAARVSLFLEEDEHIFQNFTDRSRGTLTSPCQIHGIPSEQEKEEG